ncbi:MAG: pyridoxal phosphate-dependent aminotransferase [archaeon]|nr:pyridoxal phosphate-dependent aminotransferase [archaeon]
MSKMKEHLSERVTELPDSVIGELIRIAEEDKSIISLGPGEPDFSTPKTILDFGKKMLDQKYTHYSPPGGRKELKELIAKKAKKENKIKIEDAHKQIVVLNGSTEAIMLSLMCFVDAGEEVLVPNPSFLSYVPSVELLNGFAVNIPLEADDGFQINPDIIKGLISKKTKAIILNSPSNPTGTVLKKKLLEEIAEIAIENNLMILSDEAYEYYVYGEAKHESIGALNGMQDNVLTMQSFSKSFAMPGFRVGYAIGPEWLINPMTKIHVYSSLCAPTISQKMAEKALVSPRKEIEKMRKDYDKRRKLVLHRLAEIPLLHVEKVPEGAFYVFPKIQANMSSMELSKYLLKEAKVSVVPGTEFGKFGEGFIRISYATNYFLIEKAMDRIEKAMRKLK